MNLFLQTQYYLSKGSKVSLALLMSLYLTEASYAETHNKSFSFSVNNSSRENITGTVKDEKGEPLPGVTVKIKGTTTATTTDVNGVFRIDLPTANEILVISFVGFKTQEVAVNGKASLEIRLVEDAQLLSEVVVNVGYGTKVKLGSTTGAVAAIKGEEFEDLPVANLSNALIDRIAGVNVNIASGKPGATSSLQIRNPTLFAASGNLGLTSSPLYVIDGITMTEDDFNNLDASVVDNITILKDASAAIYGAAGAKGVVLVTTKRGKIGKPKIGYTGYYGFSDAASKPKLLSAYDHAKYLNDGYELAYAQDNLRFSQADLNTLASNSTQNWYDQLWKPSSLQRHTLNLSGGSKEITYNINGNYYDEGGNFGEIDVNKYGLRSSVTANVTPSITLNVDLNGSMSKKFRNSNKNSDGNSENVMMTAMYLTPGWVPLTINGVPNNWAQAPNPPTAWNPLALFNSGTYEKSDNTALGVNTSLTYNPKFLPGLSAKVQYARNHGASTSKQYYIPYRVYNFNRTGQNGLLYTDVPAATPSTLITRNDRLSSGTGYTRSYQLIAQLSYKKQIKQHNIDVLAVTEQTESQGDNYAVYRDGQQIPGLDEFFAFNTATTTADIKGASESGKRSYLTRASYSFADKYLMDFVGRYDGSANFPPDKRWGFFPSIGFGWKVSEENFFKDNVTFIDFLKLKANFGLIGDDRVTKYQYIARFTQAPQAYLFGNQVVNGVDPNIYPNPDITWEKSRTQNYGIEMAMLNNKLNFSVDIWNRHTYDGFDDYGIAGIPWVAGTQTGLKNYSEQDNWGTEFSLGYNNKINKDWGFSLSANAAFSDDRRLNYYYNAFQSVGNVSQPYDNPIMVGRSSRIYNGSNYGYIATGIIKTQAEVDAILAANPNYLIGGQKPQVGFMNYKDVNNDGIINDSDITLMYPRGTASALGMGFTFGLSYKTFKLSTNMNLSIGGKEFVDGDARKVPTITASGADFWKDHWTPENPNAKYPRFDSPLFKENSTFWAVSGTTARVNNMTLSFSIPKSITQKAGISDVRGVLTGNNLWDIINPYDYKDSRTGNFASYPTLRTFSLGLNIGL